VERNLVLPLSIITDKEHKYCHESIECSLTMKPVKYQSTIENSFTALHSGNGRSLFLQLCDLLIASIIMELGFSSLT
jgi:hypothetical protein